MSSTTTLKAVLVGQDKSMGRTFDTVGRKADSAGKKSMGFGTLAKKGFGLAAGALAAGGIAVGISSIVGLLGSAVTEASNLQQALGGADAVFGKSAGRIKKNADKAADALGLSKSAYLDLATVLGAGLKNKGIKDYTRSTEGLLKIGADLAAQYGGDTKDAVDALASAMRGESDPIERYGISLNETAVNAKLVEMGVKKVNGKFTEQQKTMGRLALITQQSKDALGAFGRESDTLAGSNARLSANWENLKGQIGTKLLPMLTRLSGWFLKKGLPAIERFGGWVQEHLVPQLSKLGKWFTEKGLPAVKKFAGWVRDELWPALQDGWNTVKPGLEEAKGLIMGAFGGDTGQALKTFGKIITEKVIPVVAQIVRVWIPALALQYRGAAEAVKFLWKAFQVWGGVVTRVAITVLTGFAKITSGIATFLRALSHIPGFGWARTAADKLDGAARKARDLANALRGIKSRKVTVSVYYKSVSSGRFDPAPTGYSPGRAGGGDTRRNRSYLVGEHGPEIWSENASGHITPARQTAQILAGRGGTPSASRTVGYDGPEVVQVVIDGRVVGQALLRQQRLTGPIGLK